MNLKIYFLANTINNNALKNFRNEINTSAEILNDQNFLKKKMEKESIK